MWFWKTLHDCLTFHDNPTGHDFWSEGSKPNLGWDWKAWRGRHGGFEEQVCSKTHNLALHIHGLFFREFSTALETLDQALGHASGCVRLKMARGDCLAHLGRYGIIMKVCYSHTVWLWYTSFPDVKSKLVVVCDIICVQFQVCRWSQGSVFNFATGSKTCWRTFPQVWWRDLQYKITIFTPSCRGFCLYHKNNVERALTHFQQVHTNSPWPQSLYNQL